MIALNSSLDGSPSFYHRPHEVTKIHESQTLPSFHTFRTFSKITTLEIQAMLPLDCIPTATSVWQERRIQQAVLEHPSEGPWTLKGKHKR